MREKPPADRGGSVTVRAPAVPAPGDEALDPDEVPTWLTRMFPPMPHVIVGAGTDDCGVFRTAAGVTIVSTDFINARPICLEYGLAGIGALGRLAAGHNLSDLCGTGAEPTAFLIGITAQRGATTSQVKAIMAEAGRACAEWGVPLIGGDTKLGRAWAIYGVAIGSAPDADALFLKNRARPGEDLWVSGPVGDCCAGMLAYRDFPGDPGIESWARRCVTEPALPLGLSRRVAGLGIVRAGTDLSDGLTADVGDLCRSSGVGAVLSPALIPTSPEVRRYARGRGVQPWAYGAVLGGDLQFVVTAPPEHRDTLAHAGLARIGTIVEGQGLFFRRPGGEEAVTPVPELGHRDARGLAFADEARVLVRAITQTVGRQDIGAAAPPSGWPS